ncbi:hypothetical protein F5Y18DRAFT_431752 [Xylariaceae sp. FL1019]|nr:hypothetical protein F5Y18DRAFT_431752 [Xylariaceae sp. FL1019]
MSNTLNSTSCDINSFPDWRSLDVPHDEPLGGLKRSNETVIAMNHCCKDGNFNTIDDCILWCELSSDETSDDWSACTRRYITEDHIEAYQSTATSHHRPTTLGLGAVALLVSGFLIG